MVCEFKEFFGKIVPRCIFSYGLIFLLTFAELFMGFSLLRIENSFGAALLVAVLGLFGFPLCLAFLGRLHERGIIDIPVLNKE